MRALFKYGFLSFATCLSLLGASSHAFADPHDRGRDRDNNRGGYHQRDRDNDRWRDNNWHNNGRRNHDRRDNDRYGYKPGVRHVVVINTNDRSVIRSYVHRDKVRMVPVYYAPRYLIGAPLPREIIYYSVPNHVTQRLRPIPLGYRYVRVDNDVLLISVRDNIVWDAVSLI